MPWIADSLLLTVYVWGARKAPAGIAGAVWLSGVGFEDTVMFLGGYEVEEVMFYALWTSAILTLPARG